MLNKYLAIYTKLLKLAYIQNLILSPNNLHHNLKVLVFLLNNVSIYRQTITTKGYQMEFVTIKNLNETLKNINSEL